MQKIMQIKILICVKGEDMATKDGWNNKFTISGVLNLDDDIIAIERGDDEPIILADSIERLNGKDVTIVVSCEEPT